MILILINCYIACISTHDVDLISVHIVPDMTIWDLFILRYLNSFLSCFLSLFEILNISFLDSAILIHAPFIFRGLFYLEPIGLSRFKRSLDSLAVWYCPSGTSILIGAFTAGTCDLITFLGSVNESGNSYANLCNRIISIHSFWTSILDL